VVLYLNNFDQPASRDGCCPNEDRSQASGIHLSVVEHNKPTDMTRGIAVSPGTEATVIMSEADRRRLAEPYGNCTDKQYLGDPSDKLEYSVHGCQQLCLQSKV
jgi:Amiloride-sensitive sodium channel